MPDPEFWEYLDRLVAASALVIDRPKGSAHPRYPDVVYPLDYGYLAGTVSTDGGGIDVWLGTQGGAAKRATAVVCTVDLIKRDLEMKILLGCTQGEMQTVVDFHDSGDIRCILMKRHAIEAQAS